MTEKKRLKSINELAEIAGVSKATVSRALNDSPLVTSETKKRIRKLAEEHSFLPSSIARNLSLRSSKTIGFVTHAYSKKACGISDPFGVELMGGAAVGLHEMGYDMLIVHVDPKDTKWAGEYLDSGKVDGFILVTSEQKRSHIDLLQKIGAPFVAWGDGRGQFTSVRGDDYQGGKLAAERLISRGCRHLACICGPDNESDSKNRLLGFTEQAEHSGIEIDPELIDYGNYGEQIAKDIMQDLLSKKKKIDGLFAFSDLMASGAMEVLIQNGVRIPDDIALIGYDDLQLASYVRPSLTTISQHISEAGKLLAKSLVNSLNDKTVSSVIMPVELVVRNSA